MIVKQGRGYGVRVHMGGGRKKWLGTFDKKSEAQQVERDFYLKRPRKAHTETCDSFAARWLEDYPRSPGSKRSRGPATVQTYTYALRAFAREFAGVLLGEVSRPEARRWALKNKSSVGPVRAMFTDAVRDGLVRDNPFSNLGFERPSRKAKLEQGWLTPADIETLQGCALEVHDEPYGQMVAGMIGFAAYTGIRPSELWALEYGAIDLAAQEYSVRHHVNRLGKVVQGGKNTKPRTCVLPPPAIEALGEVPRLHPKLVFTSVRGYRLGKTTHTRMWDKVRCRFGRPKMEFYELKHFAATYMYDVLGLSLEDIAYQLGHTDTGELAFATYTNPSDEAARERIKRAWRRPAKVRQINEARERRFA